MPLTADQSPALDLRLTACRQRTEDTVVPDRADVSSAFGLRAAAGEPRPIRSDASVFQVTVVED